MWSEVAFAMTTVAIPFEGYRRIMLWKPRPPPSLNTNGIPGLELVSQPSVMSIGPLTVRCRSRKAANRITEEPWLPPQLILQEFAENARAPDEPPKAGPFR